jgi:uncharacterized protein (TIGR02147 family)
MAKKQSPGSVKSILQAALRRKKLSNPAYSLRALARDLGVSPAFASKVMSGQKLPPRERLEKLCYLLELDVLEKEAIIKAVLLDSFGAKFVSGEARSTRRQTAEASSRQLLAHWANLAVLEGLTLDPPMNDLAALRERLGLSPAELKRALDTLAEAGLIALVGDHWEKKDRHLYLAGGRSKAEVRAFHMMMIEKGKAELQKTTQADYERRLVNGFTLALNPDHLERLKAKIIDFLDELSREAGEGVPTDVYQCNVQFFPLTKALKGE